MNKDLEHLRSLKIGFYTYAGISALVALVPILHIALGLAMVFGEFDKGPNPPPPMFGWFFVAAGSTFLVIGMVLAFMTFLAGRFLSLQKNYLFIFVIAAINCMFVPLGTILGVFTFVVLMRDSVKELFNKPKTDGLGEGYF